MFVEVPTSNNPIQHMLADSTGQRRFAASMIVHALQTIQPILNSSRTDPQYYEAVEALVWMVSPASDFYFEILGFDPEEAKKRIDLAFYAELAHSAYATHKEYMRRMYIQMARWSLQERRKRTGEARIPYAKMVFFAEQALSYTTYVIDDCRRPRNQKDVSLAGKKRGKTEFNSGLIPAYLTGLTELMKVG